MPLSAYVNGERRVSLQLNTDEWKSLKALKPRIELCCCRAKGFMRVSKLGTQHFVHARKNPACSSPPESPEHLMLKAIVVEAIQGTGWSADVEVAAPDGSWRADVMALRGKVRVALEIQLSPINAGEMKARQERYERDGVRGCWFFGGRVFRTFATPPSEIPAFPLSWTGDRIAEANVSIGLQKLPVPRAVRSLLAGHFRLCDMQAQTQEEVIRIFRFSHCYSCKNPFEVFSLGTITQGCEQLKDGDCDACDLGWEPAPIQKSGAPWIAERVERFVKENPSLALHPAYPGRFRATSSGINHYTFSCARCGALIASEVFEQLFSFGECSQDLNYFLEEIATIKLKQRRLSVPHQHWCYSPSGAFCEPASRPARKRDRDLLL